MDLNQQEVHASLWLNAIHPLNPDLFRLWIERFGTARNAVSAGPEGLGIDPGCFAAAGAAADQEICDIEKKGIRTYFAHTGPYPLLLKETGNSPPVLYSWGDDLISNPFAIALVGSRRCSYYGETAARLLSEELVEAGVVTISGLARGIDTCVHRTSLDCGGRTWAVIGSGLNKIYPPENKKLAERILKSGAVISEFPLETRPFPANFPRRNRIIAALSRGTVVVEGNEKSGSLITARLAAEMGRDVYCVPGPITSGLSSAPHRLIQFGAKLIQKAEDILEDYDENGLFKKQIDAAADKNIFIAPKSSKKILSQLESIPLSKEILAARTEISSAEMGPLLLEMELKGLIKTLPGGFIAKIAR